MKLSIITVNLNNAEGLRKTIDSVINQTYTYFEHIIIDGGSTDGSVEVIKEYETLYKEKQRHLYWVSEPDKGIYDAMNRGVRLTKGEWIYFLGSDDILLPDALNDILTNQINDFDCVYGNVKRVPSNLIYDGEFDLKKLFYKNICHQAIFYKKELFNKIGLFNIKYKARADYAFNIQVFTQGYRTKYLPITIAEFNDGGFSSAYFDLDFWADYQLNYIKPFKSAIKTRERYSILWKYYYALLNNNKFVKALKLFFIISFFEHKLKRSFQSFKYLMTYSLKGARI